MKEQISESKVTLYKYRSLENLERFLDILINERIHASKLENLNDPMEGCFDYSKEIAELCRNLKTEMNRYFICSFSKSPNIGLMWVHYANKGMGCCLELDINKKHIWRKLIVNYVKEMGEITKDTVAEDLLSQKYEIWKCEDEVRYIRKPSKSKEKTKSMKFEVKIKKIILGYDVSREIKSLIEKLVEKLFKNGEVSVEKINKKDIRWTY